MDVFRTPDERFEDLPGYPYEPNYVEVDGLRLHHLDEGSGSTVLCFHGEPSWSYLYRHMLERLVGEGQRVVCPDLVGFGRSDKPTDQAWYTYDRHVETVTAHLDQVELDDVTVVVQDWGGPIGLRWAMENPGLVARIVILNTGLFSGRDAGAGLRAWLDYARAQTDLDVGNVVSLACGGLPPSVVAGYDAPFPDVTYKAGPLSFPRLVPTSIDDPGAREQMAVRDALDAWDGPVTVAFADGDPIFPAAVGESWARRLRQGSFRTVEGAGHFLQEMRPDAVADAILTF